MFLAVKQAEQEVPQLIPHGHWQQQAVPRHGAPGEEAGEIDEKLFHAGPIFVDFVRLQAFFTVIGAAPNMSPI